MSDAQAGLMLFGMLASALFVVFAGVAAMAFRSGAGAIMGGALGVVTSIVLSWSFDWLSNGQTVVIVLLASGLGALAIFVWR